MDRGLQGQGYKETSFFALQVLLLSSHHCISEGVELRGKGMGGGGYDNCLALQEERFSLPGPSWGQIHKLPYAGDEHRSGGIGDIEVWSKHRAEESVNEGTAQVEKVSHGFFF